MSDDKNLGDPNNPKKRKTVQEMTRSEKLALIAFKKVMEKKSKGK